MEREVGGGIGMGNTCKPMAVSFQLITKSTTIKKKKKNIHLKKKKSMDAGARLIDIGLQVPGPLTFDLGTCALVSHL